MGDKIIFSLIGFFLGGMAGFFVGGAVCAKEYKKTIQQLQVENETLVEEAKKKAEKALSDREKAVQKAEVKYHIEDIIKKEQYASKESEKKEDEDSDDTEDSAEFDSDEDVEFDDPFDEKRKGFRILSEKEYEEDSRYVTETESFTYYQEDKILADAFDDTVSNGTNIVGAEAMLLAEKTDADFIYVSDDDEEKLYEIQINHEDSFYRDAQK